MLKDTTLTLGSFEFGQYEVPEEIPFGGVQHTVAHTLVGGKKIVDAMGATQNDIQWSGFFVGITAMDRALYLDGLRKAGQPLLLTWDRLSFNVLIKEFKCNFKRFYRLPYSITLEVLEDKTDPVTSTTTPDYDALINQDAIDAIADAEYIDAQNQAALSYYNSTALANPVSLGAMMATLSASIAAVKSFKSAPQSSLQAVLGQITAVTSAANLMLGNASLTISSNPVVGALSAFSTASTQAAQLMTIMNAVQISPNLQNLLGSLGRIAGNIAQLNSGTKTVTQAGGNLYTTAATQYGDPMGYTAIMQANNLKDPNLSGVQTVVIPPLTNNTNGLLNV